MPNPTLTTAAQRALEWFEGKELPDEWPKVANALRAALAAQSNEVEQLKRRIAELEAGRRAQYDAEEEANDRAMRGFSNDAIKF